jgi:hypothetical protein
LKLRLETGRPHWIVIDEAHHLLPSTWASASVALPQELAGLLLITVHPNQVAPMILTSVNVVIAVGESPQQTLRTFSQAIEQSPPQVPPVKLERGEAIAWYRQPQSAPFRFRSIPPQTERQRHIRKYAEGEMTEDTVFYFRGPEGKLNLRAQNLITFIQLAEGIDDETWLYHLRRGDYSRWFRESVNDEELADEAEKIEKMPDISTQKSRALIKAQIEARYTSPA